MILNNTKIHCPERRGVLPRGRRQVHGTMLAHVTRPSTAGRKCAALRSGQRSIQLPNYTTASRNYRTALRLARFHRIARGRETVEGFLIARADARAGFEFQFHALAQANLVAVLQEDFLRADLGLVNVHV